MIHIAICDDNYSDAERIEEQLLQLRPRFTEKIETSIYYSGQSFCEMIKDNCPFDIVLMDIEMDGINGIMAGKKLRSDDENDMVLLLYISSHEDYFYQLFDVQPFAFIGKPINQHEFYNKLERAISKIIRRRNDGKSKVLPVCQKGREVMVPFKRIMYFESKIRKICLFTTDCTIDYYGTLSKEEQKLSDDEFVRTHQSYIVNLRYVKEVTSETLILIDKTQIPISNSRKSSVKDAYMTYRRNCFE